MEATQPSRERQRQAKGRRLPKRKVALEKIIPYATVTKFIFFVLYERNHRSLAQEGSVAVEATQPSREHQRQLGATECQNAKKS